MPSCLITTILLYKVRAHACTVVYTRVSSGAVVVLADWDCQATCAFGAVASYISAAQSIGSDLPAGHLFRVGTAEGGRGCLPFSAARKTATLQGHLRAAELPSHFTMHYFRVGGSLSKSLAGTAVDEIMKFGGWKTESITKYYIGGTSNGKVHGSKRKRGQATPTLASYRCRQSLKNMSQRVRERVDAMLRNFG